MSSVFGISSSDNNYFSTVLNSKKSSSGKSESSFASDLSQVFSSSGNSALGDYALIQSGAYKKLLNAYYSKQNSSGSAEGDKTEKINLSTAGSDASALSGSIGKLMDIEVNEDNRETVKNQLKDAIDKYNSLIDSASNVDNVAVLRQALWMTEGTSAVASTLTASGITIGEGNKLVLDEAKFDKAGLYDIKTLVEGRNSYFSKLASRAELLDKASKIAITGSGAASIYKPSGEYSKLNAGNIIDELN